MKLKLLILAIFICANTAWAGPFEDAVAAYGRKDYPAALKIFKSMAAQGDASAQHNLSLMYLDGQGVVQDYAEAMKWSRLAAEQGQVLAQFNLGVGYAQGQGVAQDYKEAMRWYC